MTVALGTFAYYDGGDESCTGIPYGLGESFVDVGQGHVSTAGTCTTPGRIAPAACS